MFICSEWEVCAISQLNDPFDYLKYLKQHGAFSLYKRDTKVTTALIARKPTIIVQYTNGDKVTHVITNKITVFLFVPTNLHHHNFYMNLVEAGWITNDKQVLTLADSDGWTVAHEQVAQSFIAGSCIYPEGWTTRDRTILSKRTSTGWSVAHQQARVLNWTSHDKKILKLGTINGWTVAHEMALYSYKTGWTTDDEEILQLTDDSGITVYSLLQT